MADVAASQAETVLALLERSRRNALPLRRSFVQIRQHGGGGGPLAAFVRGRHAVALDLYLLGRAVASQEPFDVALPSRVWARALGLPEASSAVTISNSWKWLEEQKLITSVRTGRLRNVQFLREDGSGVPYEHPGRDASAARGDYFKLPYAYWIGHYPGRLGLPAKALLLIALSLGEDFWLPHERGARWYGLSRDTVSRGLATLLRLGLLEVRVERKKAPLIPQGFTDERRYALRPPFGTGFPTDTQTGASIVAARRQARAHALADRSDGRESEAPYNEHRRAGSID